MNQLHCYYDANKHHNMRSWLVAGDGMSPLIIFPDLALKLEQEWSLKLDNAMFLNSWATVILFPKYQEFNKDVHLPGIIDGTEM